MGRQRPGARSTQPNEPRPRRFWSPTVRSGRGRRRPDRSPSTTPQATRSDQPFDSIRFEYESAREERRWAESSERSQCVCLRVRIVCCLLRRVVCRSLCSVSFASAATVTEYSSTDVTCSGTATSTQTGPVNTCVNSADAATSAKIVCDSLSVGLYSYDAIGCTAPHLQLSGSRNATQTNGCFAV